MPQTQVKNGLSQGFTINLSLCSRFSRELFQLFTQMGRQAAQIINDRQ